MRSHTLALCLIEREDLVMKVASLLVLVSSLSIAATIRVPQDFESIQAACDAAEDGDTVLLFPPVAGGCSCLWKISFPRRLYLHPS